MSEYEGYAIVELMGHRQRPGYVREVEIAGSKMLRIDIPVSKDDVGQDVTVTEYYGASAVYALRPCTEEIVREQIGRYGADPRPARPLDYRDAPKLTDQSDDLGEDEE